MILISLTILSIGDLVTVLATQYHWMAAGRLLSGTGAVLLNVLMTSMVSRWFPDKGSSIAMRTIVSSWPLGIAIALLVCNPLKSLIGLFYTLLLPAFLSCLALLMTGLMYTEPGRNPALKDARHKSRNTRLTRSEVLAVSRAGLAWGLYNVSLILILSFSADYLLNRGFSLSMGSAIVSLASLMIIPTLPIGAMLAEYLGRPTQSMVGSFLLIAVLIIAIPLTTFPAILFVLLGAAFGPGSGLIMSMPGKILRPETRTLGMGVFWSVYYMGMGTLPSLGGYVRDLTNAASAPLYLAAAFILVTIPLVTVAQRRPDYQLAVS